MWTWIFNTLWNFGSWFANWLERNILYAFHDILTVDILNKVFLVFAIGLWFGCVLYFLFVRK